MQRAIWFGAGVAVMAALTWAVAWWTIPIVAAAWAILRPDDPTAPLAAGVAAMAAWALLLLLASSGASVGSVLRVAGEAMRIGPGALLALTLAFAGLLGTSAAALARSLASFRPR